MASSNAIKKSPPPTGEHIFLESSNRDLEFYAEDTEITIVPTLQHDNLHLLHGDIGPFHPQQPIQVPLWLALALKKVPPCLAPPHGHLARGWNMAVPHRTPCSRTEQVAHA